MLIEANDTSCPGTGSSGSGSKPISSAARITAAQNSGVQNGTHQEVGSDLDRRAAQMLVDVADVDGAGVREQHRQVVGIVHGVDRCRSASCTGERGIALGSKRSTS